MSQLLGFDGLTDIKWFINILIRCDKLILGTPPYLITTNHYVLTHWHCGTNLMLWLSYLPIQIKLELFCSIKGTFSAYLTDKQMEWNIKRIFSPFG
jgi:hypothetical protein